MSNKILSLRVPDELRKKLEEKAKSQYRSMASVAKEGLSIFLEANVDKSTINKARGKK
jgi:predicted transcriptional regulator